MEKLTYATLGMLAALLILPAALIGQSRIELEGPISSVEGTTITLYGDLVRFEAAGATIDSDDENFRNISDLKTGTNIEVDGTSGADGSITATDVEVSDERDPDTEIGGVISTVDEAAGTFTIGPVTVHWDGATKLRDLSELRAGVLVEATLDVSGGRLRASMVEREEDDD